MKIRHIALLAALVVLSGCSAPKKEETMGEVYERLTKERTETWETLGDKEPNAETLCGNSESILEYELKSESETTVHYKFACLRNVGGSTLIHRVGDYYEDTKDRKLSKD